MQRDFSTTSLVMRKRVYIETTIPSFYFEPRPDPEMVARREWTRRWWGETAARYEVVTSAAVVEELSRGDFPAREDCLRLIERLPLVPVEPAVAEIVEPTSPGKSCRAIPPAMRSTWHWRRTIVATFSLPGTATTLRTQTSSTTSDESTRCWGCSFRPS